jgi:hypothetical protein
VISSFFFSATAHEGGTVGHEKNHITAQFQDKKGNAIPSKWTDSKTGKVHTGLKNQHQVYTDNKKTKSPSSWNKAVQNSKNKQAANQAANQAASHNAFKQQSAKAKQAGIAKGANMSADDKKAQRQAAKQAKKSGKKPGTQSGTHSASGAHSGTHSGKKSGSKSGSGP